MRSETGVGFLSESTSAVAVVHMDAGRRWAGGQNQIRLLMRGLERCGIRQLCLCPVGSALEARLRADRLPVRGVRWRGGADPRAIWAVGRVLAGFQVVHCHDAHALQVALIPARMRGRPIIASRRVPFRTNAFTWNRADRVIAVSATVRERLAGFGVSADHVRTIFDGVDAAEIAGLEPLDPPLRRRIGIGPDAFLVGNIGHLYAHKGQESLPAAAARLPGTHWVIIGEGPRRAALESAIATHGVERRVHLAGYIPDARRALREMDLFVFSSTADALGTSVLDALAVGVPVVAADTGGPAEVMAPVHAETGASLYPPGDAAALAALVRRVREDAGLRARMRKAQRDRLEDFRAEAMVERTLRVYQELITP